MPNHFHFLVHVHTVILPLSNGKSRTLNQSIAIMLRSYTRAINEQQNRSGALFREGTKAKNGIIDGFITLHGRKSDLFFMPENNYALHCFNYIHENPAAAGLVKTPEEWPYSSAPDYAGLRNGTLCNQQLARELLLF
jgi:putative transposase